MYFILYSNLQKITGFPTCNHNPSFTLSININLCNCIVLLCGTICFLPEFLLFGLFKEFQSKFFKNLKLNRKKKPKKVKITTRNILSQMITQCGWIYKFIQFNLIVKCANFYGNPWNMKEARHKMLFICLGTNIKRSIPEIMKLRIENSPKIE